MTVSKARTKTTVVLLADQLAAGTTKHLAANAQVTLLGTAYTPAQLASVLRRAALLQANLDAANAAAATRLAEQRQEMASTILPLMRAIMGYAKVTFGNQPDVLADFRVDSTAPRVPTVDVKAAAAVKRVATREARGTKGKVQRKAIKGDVAGIEIQPVRTAPVGETPPRT